MLVIAAVVVFNPFDGGDGDGSSSTTPTSAVPSSTTEPAIASTTTTSPPEGWDDGRYLVVGVADDDVLNVRNNPGASHQIVGTLAPDARVELDGYSALSDGSEWRSVLLEDGTRGWVNATFLAPPPGWEVPFDVLSCREDGAEYGGTQTVPGTVPSERSGNALDIFTYHSEECDRIVIVLGQGEGLTGAGWSSVPAGAAPSGTAVSSGGAVVEIRIPGVLDARPVAQTVESEFGYVLATRDMPLAQSREELVFRAFFEGNRRAAIQVHGHPCPRDHRRTICADRNRARGRRQTRRSGGGHADSG